MKIRNGFVSNSSSSSFSLYGANLNAEDLKQFLPEGIDFDDEEWGYEIDWYDIETEIRKVFGGDWSFYYDGECLEDFYIGKELDALKDDETGKQFRDSIKDTLKEILKFEELDCCVYNEIVQS